MSVANAGGTIEIEHIVLSKRYPDRNTGVLSQGEIGFWGGAISEVNLAVVAIWGVIGGLTGITGVLEILKLVKEIRKKDDNFSTEIAIGNVLKI